MVVLLYVLLCLFISVSSLDKYTDKYDNIDIDEILANRRLLIAYANCILDKGKCTPEGKELKENLQDAIENGCKKCTEVQEKGATKIIMHAIKNETQLWNELVAKYDPDSKWRKKYEDRAKTMGITLPN